MTCQECKWNGDCPRQRMGTVNDCPKIIRARQSETKQVARNYNTIKEEFDWQKAAAGERDEDND